ncbi:MAG: hypothetical protein RSC91_00475, partial [Clostridia bacterium]
ISSFIFFSCSHLYLDMVRIAEYGNSPTYYISESKRSSIGVLGEQWAWRSARCQNRHGQIFKNVV